MEGKTEGGLFSQSWPHILVSVPNRYQVPVSVPYFVQRMCACMHLCVYVCVHAWVIFTRQQVWYFSLGLELGWHHGVCGNTCVFHEATTGALPPAAPATSTRRAVPLTPAHLPLSGRARPRRTTRATGTLGG